MLVEYFHNSKVSIKNAIFNIYAGSSEITSLDKSVVLAHRC